MRTLTVTTKTSAQIAADFAATFANIEPLAAAKQVTQQERLEPYRAEVEKQLERGLTWKQISAGMAGPRINEKVSARLLKTVFGGKKKKPAKARRKTTKKVPKPAAPKFVSHRVVLDPVTDLPIPLDQARATPVVPPKVAKPKRLPPRFQPVFDRVAPEVIKMGLQDDVVKGVLGDAVITDLHSETEEMNAFILAGMAEFDAFDQATALAIYPTLRPADWNNWRPAWCELRGLEQ